MLDVFAFLQLSARWPETSKRVHALRFIPMLVDCSERRNACQMTSALSKGSLSALTTQLAHICHRARRNALAKSASKAPMAPIAQLIMCAPKKMVGATSWPLANSSFRVWWRVPAMTVTVAMAQHACPTRTWFDVLIAPLMRTAY